MQDGLIIPLTTYMATATDIRITTEKMFLTATAEEIPILKTVI